MNRVPPSRVGGFHKAQIAEDKRAEDSAEAEKASTEKEHDTKHEKHHATKAQHAHHAHLAKSKPNPARPHGHSHDPHETAHAAHMAEAMGWSPETSAEAADRKAEADEAHAEEEREKQGAGGAKRVGATLESTVPANKAETAHDNKRDAFQKLGKGKADLNAKQPAAAEASASVKTADAVREAHERMLKSGKPLDAFALLNMAQPTGVLFQEESGREDYVEGQEDPELKAAIEAMLQKLFGVKGILRVGAGRNQADEPVVVVAVGQGFGEASMRAVPESVGKFSTLIALPYDILPLKKER